MGIQKFSLYFNSFIYEIEGARGTVWMVIFCGVLPWNLKSHSKEFLWLSTEIIPPPNKSYSIVIVYHGVLDYNNIIINHYAFILIYIMVTLFLFIYIGYTYYDHFQCFALLNSRPCPWLPWLVTTNR